MFDSTSKNMQDWASPPGNTIFDLLEEHRMTKIDFAKRLNYSDEYVNELMKGRVQITEKMADSLARVLGSTPAFWLAREAQYREMCAYLEKKKSELDWLEKLPIKDLMANGLIEKRRNTVYTKAKIVADCLRFFGVDSPENWNLRFSDMQGSFRRSHEKQSDIGAISAWLRMGELEAELQNGLKFDHNQFELILRKVRNLTVLGPEKFEPQLKSLFMDAGVAFVLVPCIPRAHVSGVARWLSSDWPLIQLSLYGKANDKFWFTLFHEAAHILLHAKEKKSVYLDESTQRKGVSLEERQANDWSGNFLIPASFKNKLKSLRTEMSVRNFADEIGIHPGIVVGRLQHDRLIDFSQMNNLKERFDFKKN
ncbi:MAG: helix-turn-helix domain-containing protein [Magnetococcus sp. DMHC-6]